MVDLLIGQRAERIMLEGREAGKLETEFGSRNAEVGKIKQRAERRGQSVALA